MRLIAFASIALVAGTMSAGADGCNPQIQRCPDAAYTYSVAPASLRVKRGSECGRNIPVARCADLARRFKAGLAEENKRRARRFTETMRREARDEYRDSRGRRVIVVDDGAPRRRRNDYDGESSRLCMPRIEVTSRPMATEGRACAEARKLWSVQAIEKHGGRYGQMDLAKGLRSRPHAVHEGAWRDVCTVSAVPCRTDD
jgi:hypothetical protein